MFDFGFSELLLIAALAIVLIGPKELPVVMRALGRITRRIGYIRYAFTQQFDEFLRENDIADLRKSVNFEAPEYDEAAADEEDVPVALPPVRKAGDG